MHELLVVEDDDNKRAKVETLLAREAAGWRVRYARSFRSACDVLAEQAFDLVIIDMTLPMFDVSRDDDGGRQEAFAGRELMRQMKRRGYSAKVLVLTQFDRFDQVGDVTTLQELDAELRESDPSRYLGSIHFDERTGQWAGEVCRFLSEWSAKESGGNRRV